MNDEVAVRFREACTEVLGDRPYFGVHQRTSSQTGGFRTPKLQAKVLAAIKEGPKDGSTHWSCRKLASRFHVSKDTIQRILAQADVRPHRLERYMASDDPDFESKAADVIGLYLAPPQHAAVFCVDEKTAIQALDRLDPVLPLSPGRLERHGFEYRRNGTLSLYAALDVKTGKVQGKTAERHTSAEFVDFLEQVVSSCKPQQEIHIILDNLSAHKTSQVDEFLQRNPNAIGARNSNSDVSISKWPIRSGWNTAFGKLATSSQRQLLAYARYYAGDRD